MGCAFGKKSQQDVLMENMGRLRSVDTLLESMKTKYERQIDDINVIVKDGVRKGIRRKDLLGHLRRKKIIAQYVNQCEAKREQIIHKMYTMEQLRITSMQLEAIKSTAAVFKTFTKLHNVDKIEKLQENIEDYHEQVMEIDTIIGQDIVDVDEDELEAELGELYNSSTPKTPPPIATFPSVPQDDVVIDAVDSLTNRNPYETKKVRNTKKIDFIL